MSRTYRRNLARPIHNGNGTRYLGMRVLCVGYDGTERTGTLARIQGLDPIAELDDGTWMRLDAASITEIR